MDVEQTFMKSCYEGKIEKSCIFAVETIEKIL